MGKNDPVLQKDIIQINQLPPTPDGLNPGGSLVAVWNPATQRSEQLDPRLTGGGFVGVIKTDLDVNPAIPFNYYYIDGTSGPKVFTLPDPVFGCQSEYSVTLEIDTHKVTITTVSGTADIGGATSQLIPNKGGTLKLRCNGLLGYEIVLDTRNMKDEVIITADRDFSDGDGFEHNVNYKCQTDVAILLTLPLPHTFANSKDIEAKFILEGEGSVTISVIGGGADIGDAPSQVISTSGKSISIIDGGGKYLVGQDSRSALPLSSIIMYFLTEASVIPTYLRMTTTRTDPDYGPETFLDFTTSSTSFIFLVARATDEIGASLNIPDTSMVISSILEKLSGNNAEVYYELWKRDSGGSETILGTSPAAIVAVEAKIEVNLSISLAPFSMVATDRFVIKAYGRKLGTGTDPTVRAYYEGDTPTKAILSVPSSEVPHSSLQGRDALDSHPSGAISYDNGVSGLTSDNVKDAVDELAAQGIPSIKATAQETIIIGDPLYLSGWDVTNVRHEVSKADSANSAKMPCTHIAVTAGVLDDEIIISSIVDILNLNTTGMTVNDPVYVASGGGWTNIKPLVNPQVIGNISRVNTTLGSISFNVDATIDIWTPILDIKQSQYNDAGTDTAPGDQKWILGADFINISNSLYYSGVGYNDYFTGPNIGANGSAINNIDPSKYVTFTVSDIPVQETGYVHIPITIIDSDAVFVADDIAIFDFLNEGKPGEPFVYEFDDSTVDSNPGSGKFRIDAGGNNIFISNITKNGAIISPNILARLGLNAGVYVQKRDNAATFNSYIVGGPLVDGSGYQKIPISSISGAWLPIAEELFTFTFSYAGSGVSRNRLVPTISATVLTIDFESKNDYKTTANVAATASFSIALANTDNTDIATIDLHITGSIIITLPLNSVMQDDEDRWTLGSRQLAIDGDTGESFELSLNKVGSKLKWVMSQSFG